MPLYEVFHSIALNEAEKGEFARAITAIHTRRFTVPSLFVNVRFTDVREHHMYVGGEKRSINRIIALVRAGGDRTPESFGELSREIYEAWNRILNGGQTVRDERELKAVTIQGSIVAGIENGFLLPPAGGDAAWLKANSAEFENLATGGHQDFIEITHEMHTREDLKELVEKGQ